MVLQGTKSFQVHASKKQLSIKLIILGVINGADLPPPPNAPIHQYVIDGQQVGCQKISLSVKLVSQFFGQNIEISTGDLP